jgi:superfamily I DNA and/or RNA helicase
MRIQVRDQLRAMLLEEAQIVFTTLNSSGQECFSRMSVGFRTVVVDEACQVLVSEALSY